MEVIPRQTGDIRLNLRFLHVSGGDPISYLFEKEIILFGDVQLLLDTTTVYRLARELASKMYGRDLVTMSVSITLLNAVFVLIKRKATDEARKVLNATCQLNFQPMIY